MLICDRCGVAVFEPWHNPWIDGKERNYTYTETLCFDRVDGWVSKDSFDISKTHHTYNNYNGKTLCPECEAERKNIMQEFWDGK